MTCTNTNCQVFIICQNKEKQCPANAARTAPVHNGYRAMAMQEQRMRMSSIEFKGDF